MKMFDIRHSCEVPAGWKMMFYRQSVIAIHPEHPPRSTDRADLPLPFDQWPRIDIRSYDDGKAV